MGDVTNRRLHRRLYFFETFTLLNLAAIALPAVREGFAVFGTLPLSALLIAPGFLLYALAGVAIRAGVEAMRGRGRRYLRAIGTRGWITDTLRLIVFGVLLTHAYSWIKLTVPVFHPRLFDQALWDLDQKLFFGFAPTILFLDLFSSTAMLRAIDWSYAYIFFAGMFITFAYFLSDPSRRIRAALMNGNALLWLTGAWLYMLLPSVGPAYRFPEIWLAHASELPVTQKLQAILMRNYQGVLRLAQGQPARDLNIMLGIAAFPSLHVAFQAFVMFWMRRVWTSGQVLFAIFLFVIFLGSMVTGWHYFVDGAAGIALAAACFHLTTRRMRVGRFLALRRISR